MEKGTLFTQHAITFWNSLLQETGMAQNLTAIKKDQIFMWLSRTSTVVTGNNGKHFVPEGLYLFLTPGELNGAGPGQISLFSPVVP